MNHRIESSDEAQFSIQSRCDHFLVPKRLRYACLNRNLFPELYSDKMRLRSIGAIKYQWYREITCVQSKGTHCQNVSGSSSRKHSAPKPNLWEDTDHLARWPMSGRLVTKFVGPKL